MLEEFKRRMDKVFPSVDLVTYLNSLLNLVEILTGELEKKLKMENRFSGMAKSYINSMWETISHTNEVIDDDEEIIFDRVIFLFRKQVQRDYNSLVTRKKLSQGDSTVIIIKQLLETIEDKMPEDYIYNRRVRTLIKLITKFYDNIRNQKKSINLFDFKNSIRSCIDTGKVGKHRSTRIELPDIKREVEMIEVLENPGERAGIGSDRILTEIEL